jgi:histidinol-phosphate aminotransferase
MINRRNWLKANTALLGSLFVNSLDLAAVTHTPSVTKAFDNKILVKINQNENPYGPSPLALKAIMENYTKGNRYAVPLFDELRTALGVLHGVTKEHILLGAGSSEILGVASILASQKEGHAMMADPTFRIWVGMSEALGMEVKKIPLDAQIRPDLNRMADTVNDKTRMIYICEPNNPTGTVNNPSDVMAFAKRFAPLTYVLADEAYTEYANGATLTSMVNDYPNLIIAKTFSKVYGMAGLRVGYAIAHPDTIKKLAKYQAWSNGSISNVSAAGALAALKDDAFIKLSISKNAETIQFTTEFLQNKGFDVVPSKTNFLFFKVDHLKMDVAQEMAKQNVMVRNWEASGKKYCRVSMGTMEDMHLFKEAFTKMIA